MQAQEHEMHENHLRKKCENEMNFLILYIRILNEACGRPNNF